MIRINKELILAILGSTVVSGIISTIFNYFQKDKDNRINNISSERTLWRKEIREIAEKLSSNKLSIDEFDNILVQLKVRINPLEQVRIEKITNSSTFIKNKWIEKNGYVLEIMDDIQQKRYHSSNIGDFYEMKAMLIDRITLLLKLDWERSKREIVGEIRDKVFIFFMFIYVTCFTLLVYINTFHPNNTNITRTNFYLILGLLIPFILRLFIYVNFVEFGKIYLYYSVLNALLFLINWFDFIITKGNAGINLLFIVAMVSNIIASSVNLLSKYQKDKLYKDVLRVILNSTGLDDKLLEENDIMIDKKLRDILKDLGVLPSRFENLYLEKDYVSYLESKFKNRFNLLSWLFVVFFVSIFLGFYFISTSSINYLLVLIGISVTIIMFITAFNNKKNMDMYIVDNLLKMGMGREMELETKSFDSDREAGSGDTIGE